MQMFYDKEICKTGIMVEHPVEDIIERVGCQFYTKASGYSVGPVGRLELMVDVDDGSTQEEDRKLGNGTQVGPCVSSTPFSHGK